MEDAVGIVRNEAHRPEGPVVRLTYNITAEEYIDAQHLHWRGKPFLLAMIIVDYFVLPLLGFCLAIATVLTLRRDGISSGLLVGVVVSGLLILMPLWMRMYLLRTYKRTRMTSAPCVLEFSDQHINSERPGLSRSTLEWAAVKRFREGKKILLVYVGRAAFHVLPVRAFETGEYEELRALLVAKLG